MFQNSSSKSITKVREFLRSRELLTKNIRRQRPISLLPTIKKNLEKLLCDRKTKLLGKYDLLIKNQLDFRQYRGTTDALANFLEGIREDWENGFKEVKAVFIDLKKTFDTIEQNLLLEKLKNNMNERTCTKITEILSKKLTTMHQIG